MLSYKQLNCHSSLQFGLLIMSYIKIYKTSMQARVTGRRNITWPWRIKLKTIFLLICLVIGNHKIYLKGLKHKNTPNVFILFKSARQPVVTIPVQLWSIHYLYHVVFVIVNEILTALDKEETTILVLLDYSKAFYSICHKIIAIHWTWWYAVYSFF